MKHRVADLEGALLDAAVALAEGVTLKDQPTGFVLFSSDNSFRNEYRPSARWELAGPLIERERIAISWDQDEGQWFAEIILESEDGEDNRPAFGATPLQAAMRAYVSSRLVSADDLALEWSDNEVELP